MDIILRKVEQIFTPIEIRMTFKSEQEIVNVLEFLENADSLPIEMELFQKYLMAYENYKETTSK